MKSNVLITVLPLVLLMGCTRDQPQTQDNNTNKPLNTNAIMEHNEKDFTTTILVDKSAADAYAGIMNFRGWWSEGIEGHTDKLNETFFYHHKNIHLCKLKLVEAVPAKKLVYKVLENEFSFTKDKSEWVNTNLVFDLRPEGDKTKIRFTHQGLVPAYECYEICNEAWTIYIQRSLYNFITTGKGEPNPKEGGGFNEQLDKKWNLE